jgi:hypothetical protein
MPPPLIAAFVVLLAAAAAVVVRRRSRAKSLRKLRASWGQPADRERRLETILASHRSRMAAIPSGTSLDDRTWDDLNLDDVFAAVDRSESTLGQHALYHRMRTAPAADHLEAFDALVALFERDADLRERAQTALSRLRDPQGYDLWWLARQDAIDTRPWYIVFPILTSATAVLVVWSAFSSFAVAALVAVVSVNLATRYLTDRRILALAPAFRQLGPVVATAERLWFLEADDIRPLAGPLQADTPRLRQLKTIARWVSGDPLMLSMSQNPLALLVSDIVNMAYEYLNLVFLLDANGVYFGARSLAAHRDALLRVLVSMGEVDAAISVASFRSGRGDWVCPRFRPAGEPGILTAITHPLVDEAVPNSARLNPGRGVLITGSNMSGKSTFLRTVGVTAVMAQTLNTCLAADYHAPVFHVRSCIGRADDLLTGRSYYIAEVESLLGLVEASGAAAPHLFLLDELFRGTNAVERIAAGQAILLQLVLAAGRAKPHVVLAATHDGELVDLLPGTYDAYHFGDAVAPDGLTFDHKLRPGPATTRNAIALLRIHGASDELLDRATTCAAKLDAHRGSTLQSR